jgi:TolB-like protein
MNTLGIQRIAIMPFQTVNNSALQRQAAVFLTNESFSRIQATNNFTMINSSVIEQAQRNNSNIEVLADALFSGQILSLNEKTETKQDIRRDKDGKQVTYTYYQREVALSFNYRLTRTRDGSMIGPVTKSDSVVVANDDRGSLESEESLVQRLVQRNLSLLARDVAPYYVTEKRTLENETSKDKDIKQRAKDAAALVKIGNYTAARYAFLEIYEDTGSFAAAYNVGVLIEIQGDLAGAAGFMQRVYNETGNPRARSEIARIERAMSNAGLLAAYRENQSRQDRVITFALNELTERIPKESRVAVINNSRNERDIAESVTNGIIQGLLSKRVEVVDRSNRALAEAERNYQLSGNVSDDQIVSIGNEAGASVFVLVSVTGSGGSRRLSLRALDVERNTILYQSPQSDEMNL